MDPEIEAEVSVVRALQRMETTLCEEIRMQAIATRQHVELVAESLRGDLRNVAELLFALHAKVESIRDRDEA